jgi:endonuclease/exonuclease/phosphatase family metal-dependent hydrolase
MTIHSALAAQHAQKYARDDPYVLMGDFNFTPSSSQYDLLTKGTMNVEVSEVISFFLCELQYSSQ